MLYLDNMENQFALGNPECTVAVGHNHKANSQVKCQSKLVHLAIRCRQLATPKLTHF